ncbi:neuronal acetylcholine receptor subunit beta-3-like [Mercenaria mercenaria]|uniref:neuronal acetylcholine receptor subunit beta-3-like n=1 Tax=Mercenaria mercenaria TaxID=6596 RepID=UPI00234E630E|nr:neuronal acetylcholine receptor subunit beta-3-like [Mercenaria mercenaria]
MDVRPVNNHSEVMDINISIGLHNIQEVDIVKGVLTVSISTFVSWFDQRMVWNPAEFGGITKIRISMKEVWTPPITLLNPVEFTTMGNPNSYVIYYYSGLAVFLPAGVIRSFCNFNTKYWPFDKQMCDIAFAPMDYMTDEVQLHITTPAINTAFFVPNPEWTLDGTSYYTSNSYTLSTAHFRLKLKRQSLFYILTVILPVVGIGSLAGLVFLLPSECGERVSFTVTILVALAVFLTVVEDHLPKSSEPVSLMCTFVLTGILTNCAGCVFVVLNLAIFHRDESVPKMKWHTSIVRISQCKRKNRGMYAIRMEQSEEFRPSQNNEVIKTKPTKVNQTEVNGDEVVTWRDVSKAIDRVMMYIMIIVGSVPVPILMIYISALSEYPET